ncbi:MAG: DUF3341 domain-containing protein [Armatimonadetes bacterium]|nr:DUF3341 domain-containing protein [Armatimonadota bacterium]
MEPVKNYGVVAEFETSDALIAAAKKAKEAGYARLDAYTPFPIHGLSDIIEFRDYRVRWAMFFGGVIGAMTGITLEVYTGGFDYPINAGGKPFLSWPAFLPVMYECTILFSALTGLLAMITMNGLPMPYHPVFNVPNFERASQDRFFLAVESHDPNYDEEKVIEFFKKLKATSVSVAWEDQ